jgi:hypothetical protein
MNTVAHTLWPLVLACLTIGALAIIVAIAVAFLVMVDEAREARRADDDLDHELAQLLDQDNDR